MMYTKILRPGSSGSDVLYIKKLLLQLGYYPESMTSVVKTTFGFDTLSAVRKFQRGNTDVNGRKLQVDGLIGEKTWDAIVMRAVMPDGRIVWPDHVGIAARAAMSEEISDLPESQRDFVVEALQYAYDPSVPQAYPHSLYIWGGNLYETDLSRIVITAARIESGAKRTPQYYSGGRKQMMLNAIRRDPTLSGADCSGGIVGLMRKHGFVAPNFDMTANGLASGSYSAKVARSRLRAGDWVGRPGHIGIYVGGGYVVEWMGGAYGCQLSRIHARKGYDFVGKRMRARPAWTRYRRPKLY